MVDQRLVDQRLVDQPLVDQPLIDQPQVEEDAAAWAETRAPFARWTAAHYLKHGGIFVPTPKRYFLGDEVFLLLTLPESSERLPVAGKVLSVALRHNSRDLVYWLISHTGCSPIP